ncbi:Methyltransferase domain-containing protein [Parafrankia irregularis]|uniref:Methyltransferase domain-containing protein n=1 Tax=Parafrankia irregularis TaxID=795642 RepID=A0A0S4QP02_9ACTN|nr:MULTISPECIES: methyltransferase domain-containing protein [Parafrankia]MBE3200500.1 methyltransferase domain-containing protein [Parafrankia sp. CH37]CUU56831.1 Methyltransferase domain-containing protein [Parafrankia irregularis]
MSITDDIAATRRFFGPLAETWEQEGQPDEALIAWAVPLIGVRPGDVVLDVGCGTGRAQPALRAATGPGGRLVGVDVTEPMLRTAARLGRDRLAHLLLADACALPVADRCTDVVFAGGLLPHLRDPALAVTEFRRVCRPKARLAVFHPLSRRQLVRVHDGLDARDHLLAPGRLAALLAAGGWQVEQIHDLADRYLAVATAASSV